MWNHTRSENKYTNTSSFLLYYNFLIMERPVNGLDLEKMKQSAPQAATFLKGLAHEARLMILCYLSEGEKSVQQLEEKLKISQSSVSQHLAKLRDKGILRDRREGNQVFYSIANPQTHILINSLHELFCKPK